MKNILKTFPGVIAVNDVDLKVKPGEILALVGENGAGKSTIMKVLSGATVPDKGTIIIDGKTVKNEDPHIAIKNGIAMIYQELNYIDNVSIAENIFIGRLPVKKPVKKVDYKKLRADTAELLKKVDVERDPFTEVSKISVAERQLIEIARAISLNAKVIVFDEPTSALSIKECENLLKIIKGLAAEGRAIIYITHKLEEIFQLCDRVVIMRDGKRVAGKNIEETNKAEVIRYMVGREIKDLYPIKIGKIGDVIFEAAHVKGKRVDDISFKVHKGEVVGVFGLMGSGRTGIMETLIGARRKEAGTIKLDGKPVKINSPWDANRYGIYYLPPERKAEGILSNMSIKENITISNINKIKKHGLINYKYEAGLAQEWAKKLNIKTSSLEKPIGELSGGNQQKALVAKCLFGDPKVIIINEPTRGIDVGAKAEIYRILEEMCEAGMGIVAICSEMPEIMAISNRVLCVYDGAIIGEVKKEDFNQEKFMRLAIGGVQ